MPWFETRERPKAAATVRNDCPECGGRLAVMRVIGGRQSEYWTMRCIRCGGIHLNIVDSPPHPTAH
jgi:uncharacterized Zn finger protein